MLLCSSQLLIYPLLLSNSVFRLWYHSDNSLQKTFNDYGKLNDFEYILQCNITSRYFNDNIYNDGINKDLIETDLILNFENNEFHETLKNYNFNNDNRFNMFSLLNHKSKETNYRLYKNNNLIKTLEYIKKDEDYLKIYKKLYNYDILP
jgi:hypothetical protein